MASLFHLDGEKMNLGFLIIQQMSRVLTFSKGILSYGMLLTTIFRHFALDIDSESDVRMSKPFDAIDNVCITRLGYEHDGHHWIEKVARAPTVVDVDTNEEAEMDIPPLSPTTPHSPPPHGTDSSSNCPEWYHDLSQRIDTLDLDLRALSEEQNCLFEVLESQQAEILRIMGSQFPPPLQ